MSGLSAGLSALREFILAQRAAATAPEVKMLQGVYRGYAGDLPQTVYHAGAAFKDAPRAGTFVSSDKKAVQQFGKATGAARLHTFDAKPRRGGTEADVMSMAKRMGIYDEGVPAGQYLEQGENAIYPEAAQMVEELHNLGLDHLLLNDGMSKSPSMVILDPAMVSRNQGVFVSPQKRVADYYAQKRAAQTGEAPHAEMVLIDPFAGEKYTHATMGTGAEAPMTTQARKIKPDEVVDRTQLYAKGGPVAHDSMQATPAKNEALAWLAEKLGQADAFARKPFGYDNPPAAIISDLLGIPAVQATTERLAYGEPLTSGRGWASRMRPDTEEALFAAPQFVSPLGKVAQLTKGLPVGASIKMKGGNWLSGSVEDALKGVKLPGSEGLLQVHGPESQTYREFGPRQDALNTWIDKQLKNYVRNEMATPEDPIRALAERGVLHVNPEALNFRPEMHGKYMEPGQQALAQSPTAKSWEGASDLKVYTSPAGEFLNPESWIPDEMGAHIQSNPWLNKVPPETPVHSIAEGRSLPQDLGFNHLLDELRNATNPASGLPPELLLKYSSLPQVSVPQAVERVANINAWREAQKVEANAAKANNAATVLHKDYPDKGFKWVELKKPDVEGPGYKLDEATGDMRDPGYGMLEDALKYEGDTMGHCVGGYCPDVMEGKSRIYSLRDSKGTPHTTIEVAPNGRDPYAVAFDNLPRAEREALRVQAGLDPAGARFVSHAEQQSEGAKVKALMQERYPELADLQDQFKIVQIKGKANRAPNPEYLPFVQDFVKSGKWSDVGDLQNTGLRRTSDAFNEAEQEFLRSRGVELKPYIEPEETARYQEMFKRTPDAEPGYAAGGFVESNNQGYNPARVDALVNQLRAELFN